MQTTPSLPSPSRTQPLRRIGRYPVAQQLRDAMGSGRTGKALDLTRIAGGALIGPLSYANCAARWGALLHIEEIQARAFFANLAKLVDLGKIAGVSRAKGDRPRSR